MNRGVAILALGLIPAAAAGQTPSAARGQLVWHWFSGCVATDSLMLDVRVDGQPVYSTVCPICQLRHSEIRPEPQQRVLTFRFEAAPRRFGPQYRGTEPEPIVGSIWEAGQKSNGIVLRVSFATAERVLLNTRHVARADAPARSEWIRGIELITRPARRTR